MFFSIFQDGQSSAILDLLYSCLDYPRSVIGGLYCCAEFGWNHCSFEDVRFSVLCELGLKVPIHAPFGVCLGKNIGKGKHFAVLSL